MIYRRDSWMREPTNGPLFQAAFTAGVMPSLDLAPDARRLYIDMNHWIGLSRARLRRKGSEAYASVYEALRDGVRSGRVSIPPNTREVAAYDAVIGGPRR